MTKLRYDFIGLSGCACTDLGGDIGDTGDDGGNRDTGDSGKSDGILCYKGLGCISDCSCDFLICKLKCPVSPCPITCQEACRQKYNICISGCSD